MEAERKFIRKKVSGKGEPLRLHEKGDLVYLTFPMLDRLDFCLHGISTRMGGVSSGDQGSLNLSFRPEDRPENVRENHRRLGAAIGYDPDRAVFSAQTHTTNIRVVTEKDCGYGLAREKDYRDVDGLVTDCPNIPLMTFYADCVPLLVADPVHRAIGCSHSGWRGTVADMGGETLRTMSREYGTCPEDVYAAIGPSICRDCYEVSEDVIEQFRAAYPREIFVRLFDPKDNGKYQLDLWEACRQNFLRAGVPEDHIALPDLCTCCNPSFLFSHRASHGRRGNLAAVLMLREQGS